jgi:AraC-like DNA-binding protein
MQSFAVNFVDMFCHRDWIAKELILVSSPLVHNGFPLDFGDDFARPSDDYGRFVFFDGGGAWVHVGAHAYCVVKGWGVWLPPAVLSVAHPICESRVAEIELSNNETDGFPTGMTIVRCSTSLCEMLGAIAVGMKAAKLSNCLKNLLACELRACEELPDVFVIPMPPQSSRIAGLCEAILKEPDKTGHLTKAAASIGLSVRTLSRLFSHELGTTAAGWRRNVQIAAALGLLDNGIAVSKVARMLGFRDSAFSTFFRSRLGYSPRQRRRISVGRRQRR